MFYSVHACITYYWEKVLNLLSLIPQTVVFGDAALDTSVSSALYILVSEKSVVYI